MTKPAGSVIPDVLILPIRVILAASGVLFCILLLPPSDLVVRLADVISIIYVSICENWLVIDANTNII